MSLNRPTRRPHAGALVPPAHLPGLPAVAASFVDPRGWEVAVLDDSWTCDASTARQLVDQITQHHPTRTTTTPVVPTAPGLRLRPVQGQVQGL